MAYEFKAFFFQDVSRGTKKCIVHSMWLLNYFFATCWLCQFPWHMEVESRLGKVGYSQKNCVGRGARFPKPLSWCKRPKSAISPTLFTT